MTKALLLLTLVPGLAMGQGFLEKDSPELETLRAAKFHAAAPIKGEAFTLKVLTYNVHGIAPWLEVKDAAVEAQELGRYREIARRLREARASGHGPKLVAIQEAWHFLSSRTAKEAGYPYIAEGNGAKLGKVGGSGIYILSDYPILKTDKISYKECTGWDCVATKGALHVRVAVPELGGTVDFYTTHMNADQDGVGQAKSMAARMAQIKDFAAFVKRTRDASGPAVMAADFNFTYPAADSTLFEKLTGATSAEKTCLAGSCTGDAPGPILKESDDHQFTLAGKRGGLKAIHVAQTFKEPHKGKPLSDHWALESVYSFVGARAP